jgi:hypothetical protein
MINLEKWVTKTRQFSEEEEDHRRGKRMECGILVPLPERSEHVYLN